MNNYAFFDVDQTIYPGYSMADFYLSPTMAQNGGSQIYQKDLEIGLLYQAGKITYTEAGLRAAKLSALTVQGKKQSEVRDLARQFIVNKGVKDFVVPLFDYLHNQGYKIVLVSGSVDFIVEAIAEYCHADYYHATTPVLTSEGTYTGEIKHQLDNDEKKNLIVNTYNLSQGKVIACGDSTGDIPMLSVADYAFVVSPHQLEMKDLVHSHDNWSLVDELTIVDQVKAVVARWDNIAHQ